jgi:hypothetical protein
MEYFTNASASGRVCYHQLPSSIGVMESPDRHMPIGIAFETGRPEGGLVV